MWFSIFPLNFQFHKLKYSLLIIPLICVIFHSLIVTIIEKIEKCYLIKSTQMLEKRLALDFRLIVFRLNFDWVDNKSCPYS